VKKRNLAPSDEKLRQIKIILFNFLFRAAVDMFHVFVLAYFTPNWYFANSPPPLPLMTSHLGNGLSRKCPGDLEKIPSLSLGPGT